MTPKNVYIVSAIIFFLGFVAGGVTFSALTVFSPAAPVPVPVFAPISHGGGGETTGSGSGGSCQSAGDCSGGYECIDPSPIVREGYSNLRCWKKGAPRPICLSGDTHIGTPRGDVAVKDAKEGMSVWTVDERGQKIESVIILTGKTSAPVGHKVVHIQLSDGRNLYVSPGHKVADARKAGDLRGGDILQGATVLSASLIPYMEEYTYDILPQGGTGMYFADGILLQSTLK